MADEPHETQARFRSLRREFDDEITLYLFGMTSKFWRN
jgi:hypothetical protein